MFPHEDIRREGDRTWTNKLLEALGVNDSEKELENISETIEVLDDFRAEGPLLEIMERSDLILRRSAASSALVGMNAAVTGDSIRKWWESGDEVLRRHALLSCRQSEADIIIPVASNPLHGLYGAAIAGMEFGFEKPMYQNLMIRALDHASSEVRRDAARGLLWCQPLSAQGDLLRLSTGNSTGAAFSAIETLAWYESQEVLRFANEQSRNGIESRREAFANCFYWLAKEFENELSRLEGSERQFMTDWMAPIANLLKPNSEITNVDTSGCNSKGAAKHVKRMISVREALAIFTKVKGAEPRWYPDVLQVDWVSFKNDDRKVLCDFFEHHQDPSVREVGCSIIMAFDETDALLRLLDDRYASVRCAALHNLKLVPPHPQAGAKLMEFFSRLENSEGATADALGCLFVHSSKDLQFADFLLSVASETQSENVRLSAMSHLSRMKSFNHLQSLVGLLEDEPLLTWRIHEFLLEEETVNLSMRRRRISELKSIDYLSLQISLAKYFSR